MSAAIALGKPDCDVRRVSQLRAAFDQMFVSPPVRQAAVEHLLAVQVGGKPFAIGTNQITGLSRVRRIVPLPSRLSEMLGIANIRGMIIPVFNLAAFLGLESRGEDVQWLGLVKTEETIAFGFEQFERQVEVAAGAICCEQDSGDAEGGRLLARLDTGVRPVLDILRYAREIQNKAGLAGPARSHEL